MLLRIGHVARCAYYVHESAIPIHTLESAARRFVSRLLDPVQMPREGGRFIVLGTSRDVPNMNKVLPLALYTHTPDSTALYAHHPEY